MVRKILRMLVLSFVLQLIAAAQNNDEKGGSVGISALLSAGQIDIILPINITSKIVIAPSVGYVFVDKFGADYRIGAITRFYLSDNKLSPFVGLRGGVIFGHRIHSDAMTDGLAGILGGAEYFIDKSISTGIEAQINATFSDNNSNRFGNPGSTNVNTATAIYVTFYF